jgi:putative FmdB family regulatory protein
MALYEFRCQRHGEIEEVRRMGDLMPAVCQTCGRYAHKTFSVPHVQEDRTRFWRGRDGTRYSSALGCDLPESRSEIVALARAKGVELDAHEMPHIKRAVEAGRAKRQGENLTAREIYRHIAEPREQAPTLLETLQRSGKQQAVAERIAVGYDNWSDRGALSASEMARKGAEALGSGPSVLNKGKPVE